MLGQIGNLLRRQHYVQAFAAIRLLAGLVAGFGLVAASLIWQPPAAADSFFAILALLTLVNLATVWQSSRRRIDRMLAPLAVLDTIFVALLIYLTGGIASPLVLLLLFPIGQVAIASSALAALLMALLSVFVYTGLLFLPLGLSAAAPLAGNALDHLKVFNVVVSDAAFLAFALAAGQTGHALRSQEHRLLDRTSRLRRAVGTLARLARTSARETELATILGDVLETTSFELGIARGAVLLCDGGGGGMRIVAARGFGSREEAAPPGAVIGGPLVEGVVRHRRTLTAQRRYRRHRLDGAAYGESMPGAAAAPLLVGDTCLGCLYVDAGVHPYRWSDESLLLLEAFADLTAVSVDNTQLYSGLLAEKSKLEATMGAVTDALLIYEPGGQVLLANDPFRSLFDVSARAGDLTIDGLRTYIGERQRLGLADGVDAVDYLFDAGAAELELGMPARLVQRRGKVVYDDDGQVQATVLTFHDVTEEQQAERMRSEILATVSHELRTPLTSIKGFMQIFQRRQRRGDGMASEHELRLVLEQTAHLMGLVDDLLDVSHLPGRHMRLVRSGMDLAELSRERIDQAAGETGRHIRLEVRTARVHGFWDHDKIGQVLDNLLANAMKYSEPESDVLVMLSDRTGQIQLGVRDQGVGVATEHLEQVFDAFFRVDNTTTRRTNGLGIGLYLCKRIVEQHGGEVYARSQPGSGSEFGFTLPLRPAGAGVSARGRHGVRA